MANTPAELGVVRLCIAPFLTRSVMSRADRLMSIPGIHFCHSSYFPAAAGGVKSKQVPDLPSRANRLALVTGAIPRESSETCWNRAASRGRS